MRISLSHHPVGQRCKLLSCRINILAGCRNHTPNYQIPGGSESNSNSLRLSGPGPRKWPRVAPWAAPRLDSIPPHWQMQREPKFSTPESSYLES